jgi:hypothetical protein
MRREVRWVTLAKPARAAVLNAVWYEIGEPELLQPPKSPPE